MKERKLTHIRTEHMIKNKLEKIIKARLQKNAQLVVTGEWKTCFIVHGITCQATKIAR